MDFRHRRRRGPRRLAVIAVLVVLLVVGKFAYDRYTTTVSGAVVDEYTGQPVVGALVEWEERITQVTEEGRFELPGVDRSSPVKTLTVSQDGYETVEEDILWGEQVVQLRPNVITGRVESAAGEPVANAWLTLNGEEILIGSSGDFRLDDVPRDPAIAIGAPGYLPVLLEPSNDLTMEVRLEPLVSRGIYLGFGYLNLKDRREAIVKKGKDLGLNTLVIDIKSDRGLVHAAIAPEMAKKAEATTSEPRDLPQFLRSLRDDGWYLIARVVVFKDTPIAVENPDMAIKGPGGGLYVDCEGQRWLDPYSEQAREYILDMSERTAALGFHEIQFDYVRFPTDCIPGELVYAQPNTPENQRKAIEEFLREARKRLHPLGVTISADVFGLTTVEEDVGIGQVIEGIAEHVDYVSPMVYPSTWLPGSFSSDYPPAEPYRIVNLSVGRAVQRLEDYGAKVRPWLQAYDDYQGQGLPYGHDEIVAQIDASTEAGAQGWLLWDPFGYYAVNDDSALGNR